MSASGSKKRSSTTTAWVMRNGLIIGRELTGLGRRPENEPMKPRSEEHTSELQSQSNLVCRLLLEKNILTVGVLRHSSLATAGKPPLTNPVLTSRDINISRLIHITASHLYPVSTSHAYSLAQMFYL